MYGIDQNRDEAFKWCKKSAEDGYPEAQAILGEFYLRGIGAEVDYKK